MGRRGKFRVRIRKMKPEPITRTRTVKRQAWGKPAEKKEETVLGTLLVSLICFKLYCISRKNYCEDDDDDVPTTDPEQVQIDLGNDLTAGSTGGQGPVFSNIFEGDGSPANDKRMYPNLVRVLEYVQSSSSHELKSMSSPLPGAIGEADPSSFFVGGGAATIAAPSSLPTPSHITTENSHGPSLRSTQEVEREHAHNAGDVELRSLPSCDSLQFAAEEQQQQKIKPDKKQKKSNRSKNKTKKDSKKKQAAGKCGKRTKSSTTREDSSSSKIPTVKEWAKQEEKKKKTEKEQQKKALKQEKMKQKQMEKEIAKAEKQKKAQKLKDEKESKKAEKEAAKAKKAAEKAEKVATKAKEAAAKAEAKKKKKQSKLELRMQQMLEESDRQMAAGLEKGTRRVEELKRKQEDEAREMMRNIAKTEKTIKTLQEKLERKEKKVAHLSARRDRSGHISMLVAFKLHYKITDYKRKIHSINSVINKLKKKVEAKQMEVERLAPHLLKTEVSTETQEEKATPCSSNSNDADHTDDVADNDSILDMLSYFDSESECSDDDEEEELPTKESTHSNVQEILRKAQESLQKMDAARLSEGYYHDSEDEPGYVGKGKGPASGRKTVIKCL